MRADRLFLLGVSLFTCVPGASQQVTNSAGPLGVEIISHNWVKLVIRPDSPAPRPNSETIERGDAPLPTIVPMPNIASRSPARQVYVYSATVVNKEPKAIQAVLWTYSFSDPITHARLKQVTGFSDTKIGVNQKKTLETRTVSSPPKVVNAEAISVTGSPFEERVSFECVRFADGSFWQAPNARVFTCNSLANWLTRPRRSKR
jgi:hypothetical protein